MPPSEDPEIRHIGWDEVEPLSRAERWRLGVALMLASAVIAAAERLPSPRPLKSLPRSLKTPPFAEATIYPKSLLPCVVRELTSTPDAAA